MLNETMQKGDLCLVTGITGYISSWIAKFLLDEGFKVRGTVRNLTNIEQLITLSKILPGAEIVQAHLTSEKGWNEAMKDVKWVFHVASPQAMKSEKNKIFVATSGTKFVLASAFKAESVKKIVMTSSIAAIGYGHSANKLNFDEDDWTTEKSVDDYNKSKTQAEKLAWQMASDKDLNPHNIPVSTINPSFVIGKSLVPWMRFSLDNIKKLAEGEMPMLPDMSIEIVDVRDCALMHITIMKDNTTNGHRHLCFSTTVRFLDISRAIADNYPDRGFKPTLKIAPKYVMWIMKLFVSEVADVYPQIGKNIVFKTKYPEVYHYKYTNFVAMVRDTMDGLIENGHIQINKDRKGNR
jgi:dihydroflavonol-4-reductase